MSASCGRFFLDVYYLSRTKWKMVGSAWWTATKITQHICRTFPHFGHFFTSNILLLKTHEGYAANKTKEKDNMDFVT